MPLNEKKIMVCRHCSQYIDMHNFENEWLHQPGSQRWCMTGRWADGGQSDQRPLDAVATP